jgi:N-acetylglucosamine-6-sulfatase
MIRQTFAVMISALYLCLAVSFILVIVVASADAEKRPNILLLITDDQDVTLGTFDHMPHVRKDLQQKGMTFKNAFVHTPVCCPSRSSILTGRYLHHGDLAHNNSISGNCYGEKWRSNTEPHHTFAVHARAAGYHTAFVGKYLNQYQHHKDNISECVPPGWDYWLGLEGNSRYYNYTLVEKYPGLTAPRLRRHNGTYPNDYLPLVLWDYTNMLLGKHPAGSLEEGPPPLQEPWLLVVAWPTPHGPFTPEPWALDTMSDVSAPRTPNYNTSDQHQQDKHWLIRQLQPISYETSQQMDQYYHNRLEALLTIDQHVNSMITILEHNQQLDNTFIIYTSDNGFQFGQHRLSIDKRHLYENDVRVPFVIRGPGIKANTSSNKIVSNVDIAPTILSVIVGKNDDIHMQRRLGQAVEAMSGLSFWDYVQNFGDVNSSTADEDDPFATRTDLLISYHGEGFLPCGIAECPPPLDKLWWMPDAWNNTYNCVRTLQVSPNQEVDGSGSQFDGEDSIYCVFRDDEDFVEYYDLSHNPYQLQNEYYTLEPWQVQRYEKRLEELLKG